MEQLPSRIKEWLNARKLSDAIIEEYGIYWDGKRIVIPIHDVMGNVLFNKYRRDPISNDMPKYRYDKGGTTTIYGTRELERADNYIVLCEGEFDALCLLSQGIPACTTTGGAASFSPELKDCFKGLEVIICYDNDQAGYKGAFHAHAVLEQSKIKFLPKGIKDVTDFFVAGKTKEDFLNLPEYTFPTPRDWSHLTLKKDLLAMRKEYQTFIDILMQTSRDMRTRYESDEPIQVLIQMFMSKYDGISHQIKYFKTPKQKTDGSLIAQAKAVPIPQFIKFNHLRMAPCIWHEETTPSMYWYEKQNRVKCFGCDKLGDVIDVVQQLRRVGLSDAIKIILGNHAEN